MPSQTKAETDTRYPLFVIFGSIACLHCKAKYDCPNAEQTGVRDR
jgi:hypothetical protein